MINFVERLICEKLDVNSDLQIEWAHRAFGPRTGQNGCPRSIVVRIQSYNTKQRVLRAAWAKKNLGVNERRIYFDEDFTASEFKERASPALCFLPDFWRGRENVFNDPHAAADVLREFGVSMEIPAEDRIWNQHCRLWVGSHLVPGGGERQPAK